VAIWPKSMPCIGAPIPGRPLCENSVNEDYSCISDDSDLIYILRLKLTTVKILLLGSALFCVCHYRPFYSNYLICMTNIYDQFLSHGALHVQYGHSCLTDTPELWSEHLKVPQFYLPSAKNIGEVRHLVLLGLLNSWSMIR